MRIHKALAISDELVLRDEVYDLTNRWSCYLNKRQILSEDWEPTGFQLLYYNLQVLDYKLFPGGVDKTIQKFKDDLCQVVEREHVSKEHFSEVWDKLPLLTASSKRVDFKQYLDHYKVVVEIIIAEKARVDKIYQRY